jgi:hypothetical protein
MHRGQRQPPPLQLARRSCWPTLSCRCEAAPESSAFSPPFPGHDPRGCRTLQAVILHMIASILPVAEHHLWSSKMDPPQATLHFTPSMLNAMVSIDTDAMLQPVRDGAGERLPLHMAEALVNFLARMAFLLANDGRDADMAALRAHTLALLSEALDLWPTVGSVFSNTVQWLQLFKTSWHAALDAMWRLVAQASHSVWRIALS